MGHNSLILDRAVSYGTEESKAYLQLHENYSAGPSGNSGVFEKSQKIFSS